MGPRLGCFPAEGGLGDRRQLLRVLPCLGLTQPQLRVDFCTQGPMALDSGGLALPRGVGEAGLVSPVLEAYPRNGWSEKVAGQQHREGSSLLQQGRSQWVCGLGGHRTRAPAPEGKAGPSWAGGRAWVWEGAFGDFFLF